MKKTVLHQLLQFAQLFIAIPFCFLVLQGKAQNAFNSSDGWGNGWGNGVAMSTSAGASLIYTTKNTLGGNVARYFRFLGSGSPCSEYQPNNGNTDLLLNVNQTYTSSNMQCGSTKSFFVTVPNTTDNWVFKSAGISAQQIVVFRVQGNINTVNAVAQSPSTVFPGQNVTIAATMSANQTVGQNVYLRYSLDNWTTSTVIQMNYSGTAATATIAATTTTNIANQTVRYYVFTSGTANVATNGSNADLYTINLDNNGGSNYSYTVTNGWVTSQAGNWSDAATWTANAVPPTSISLGVVNLNHDVVLNQAATTSAIVINLGASLTGSDGVSRVLTIASGGAFTNNSLNNGGYNATATSSVNFLGTGTINGTSATTFNTVVCNGALTGSFNVAVGGTVTMNSTASVSGTITTLGSSIFNGSAGASTINNLTLNGAATLTKVSQVNGILQLNAGGSLSTTQTYGTSATLVYSTGVPTTSTNREWPTTSGPRNITLSSTGTSVTLNGAKTINGTLTIGAATTLDVDSINNYGISIGSGGTIVDNGTFLSRIGTVTFTGIGTITGAITFFNVVIAGSVNFGTASTIGSGGSLQINAGGAVSANAPFYNAESTLIYNTNNTYGRGLEWSKTSGGGYPCHVVITNNTTLNIGNGGTGIARQCAGTLTINSGSTFSMNLSPMTGSVNVLGHVVNNGNLILSGNVGGDLYVTGNFTNNGTFTHNNRVVYFNGTSPTISGTNLNSTGATNSFAFISIKNGVNLNLNTPITVNNDIFFNPDYYTYSSHDDWDVNTNNSGYYWDTLSGKLANAYLERYSRNYTMPNGKNAVVRFAQNISGRNNAIDSGWQDIDARLPVAPNTNLSMRVQTYHPGNKTGSCLPYPKIQVAISGLYESITTLNSAPIVTIPDASAAGIVVTHNSSYDIYFDKPGTLTDTGGNYLAMMIWLNKSGSNGPAGERLKWINPTTNAYEDSLLVDSVVYYLYGRQYFTNNNIIINFVRKVPSTNPGNIDILSLMNFICPQGAAYGRYFYYTDGNGPQMMRANLTGATLADFNFGFEIFKAINNNNAERFKKGLTFSIDQFTATFNKN